MNHQTQQAFSRLEGDVDPDLPASDEEIQRACDTFRVDVLDKLEPFPLKTAAELKLGLLDTHRSVQDNPRFTYEFRPNLIFRVDDRLANLYTLIDRATQTTQETQP
jgi:hypothetical protein